MNVAVVCAIVAVVLIVCGFYIFTKNTSDVDAYVINLPRRSDRLLQFKNHFSDSELASSNLTVVEAVDGSDTDSIREYMPESTFKILKTGERNDHSELTPGMIGCHLSHYKTYEQFLNSGKPRAFIFEDDSKVLPTFGNTLSDLPDDWDIVMFGVQSCMNCPEFDSRFTRLHDFYGAGGYLINRGGAMKMMQYKEKPINNQIDLYIAKLCREGKLNVYSVKNNLVETAPMGTDVQMHVSA
jgi:GR25 family glycosyltransferase involved in LPS biosynthesis